MLSYNAAMATRTNEDTDDRIRSLIADGFARTLLPLFTWYVAQLSSAMLGCKLTVVLRCPTPAYKHAMMESCGKGDLFSCREILSFQTASGRRRAREALKRELAPLLRELGTTEGCRLTRHRFQEEWSRLAKEANRPVEVPHALVVDINLAEMEARRSGEIGSYSREDISDTFPIDRVVKPRLIRRVGREVGDYEETVRSLWWETSFSWDLIREIGISKNSKAWKLLGFDPSEEPQMGQVIDTAMDIAFGKLDEDRLLGLARWAMGRMVLRQTVEQPYSSKEVARFDTEETEESEESDSLGVEERLTDPAADAVVGQLEASDILDRELLLLSPGERAAAQLFRQDKSPLVLRQELGEKRYEAAQRSFERARKKLQKLRESGKLDI